MRRMKLNELSPPKYFNWHGIHLNYVKTQSLAGRIIAKSRPKLQVGVKPKVEN